MGSINWTELFDTMARELYTPVLSDVMDAMGLKGRVLSAGITPLKSDYVVVGQAFTMLCVETDEEPEQPYHGLLAAMDDIGPDTVVMVNGHGSIRSAFWGELLSTTARAAGARGVVVDGALRDSRQIMQMDFPAFARGFTPLDAKGRIEVVRHQSPVGMGGVTVTPGDVIFADLDGICAIPEARAMAVIDAALEKVRGENKVREALRAGMKASTAFRTYGVL